MGFKQVLVRLFSDYPFFYIIYFQLIRKRKGLEPTFFTKKSDYYFDAYPRSGNTYFAHLVKRIFPEKKAVHHLHKIAPMKMAINRSMTLFILIRDPSESISSNYLKHFSMRNQKPPQIVNSKLLKKMVDEYLYYYNFVLENTKVIHLINFEQLVNDPSQTIFEVSQCLNMRFSKEEIEKKVELHKKTYTGAASKYGSSKPSNFKEEKKAVIKNFLPEINNFSKCIYTYKKLIKIQQ